MCAAGRATAVLLRGLARLKRGEGSQAVQEPTASHEPGHSGRGHRRKGKRADPVPSAAVNEAERWPPNREGSPGGPAGAEKTRRWAPGALTVNPEHGSMSGPTRDGASQAADAATVEGPKPPKGGSDGNYGS
jgi:hypothetical protein